MALFRGPRPGRAPAAPSASPGPSTHMCKTIISHQLGASSPGHPAAFLLPEAEGPPVHPCHSQELMVIRGERCRAEGAERGGGWRGEEEEEEE